MWDQGSLLKSVDVIGARGKNWPLNDGKDQVKVIAGSVEAALSSPMGTASVGDSDRPGRRQSRGGANGDKHSSLSLFTERNDERADAPASTVTARAATAKPPPRDYHDLFAAGASLPKDRSVSPSKGNALKAGAGKHHHENRLFDSTPVDSAGVGSPDKISIKTNPTKYNHFEFGEPDKSQPRPTSSKQDKHGPQWNFEDFVTPQKTRERKLPHNERNFGWSDDEEEAKKPPVHRQHVPKARPDGEPHFEFNDEATPTQNAHRPGSRPQNEQQLGLYEDHIMQRNDTNANSSAAAASPAASEKMPLGNITNVNNKGHNKNFSSQFEMHDNSPTTHGKSENVSENRKKAANHMQSSWDMYDESPKDREVKQTRINIQGDGMGSRKNTGEKSWWEY